MALSNTAVPKYYGMFRDAVIRGEIPVNKEISMEMNRIDDLIANPGVYYDDRAVSYTTQVGTALRLQKPTSPPKKPQERLYRLLTSSPRRKCTPPTRWTLTTQPGRSPS